MPQDPSLPETATLHFRRDEAGSGALDEAVRGDLSALELTGRTLWTASDETCRLERLVDAGDGHWGEHAPFPLADFFDLPTGADGEVDVEGLCADGDWLWVTGSMSLARRKPQRHEHDRARALDRLTQVKTDPNRFLLGRIPCQKGPDGVHTLLRRVEHADGTVREAACLKMAAKGGNSLTKLLRGDEHIGRFLEIPAKENGFDVEGIAAITDGKGVSRVFLGLRGPVLRGWAVVLELRLEEGKPGRLRLGEVGPDGDDYLKHFLDLDGLGIRDLKVDGDDLLILAGPTMDLDGPVELWRWPDALASTQPDVVDSDRLVRVMPIPPGEGFDHAEGFCLIPGGEKRRLMVAYDNPGEGRCHGNGSGVDVDLFPLE